MKNVSKKTFAPRFRKLTRAFAQNRNGVSAIGFGLMVFPVLATAGVGIDYGRAYIVKSQLQSAVDSAVLGAATDVLGSDAEVEAQAQRLFDQNKPTYPTNAIESAEAEVDGPAVSFDATAKVPTLLSRIFNINELDVEVSASANRQTDGAEVVIGLDTTGSMGFGRSWDDAKEAMAEMIVELDSLSQNDADFHATFFPFADRVNVGEDRAKDWLAGPVPPNGHWGKAKKANGGYRNTSKWCLEPRDELIGDNPNALTDKSPDELGFIPTSKDQIVSYLQSRSSTFTCPSQTIMGPTTNIGQFEEAIEDLSLKGTGRFDLGMAWIWRLLSPNWQGEWGVPGYPSAYGESRKIAVFVSDAYTEAYRYEVPNQINAGDENPVFGYNKGSTKGFENLLAVCQGMKAQGIEIHMVYVNGNEYGVPYMKQCATNEANYYHNVKNVEELQASLRKISKTVVSVSLNN
ncbi:MAG: TadE/TadG family type IV pilus assembly protein [Pseudomonadota bacterium]